MYNQSRVRCTTLFCIDGRGAYFTVSGGTTNSLIVPWSNINRVLRHWNGSNNMIIQELTGGETTIPSNLMGELAEAVYRHLQLINKEGING